MKKRLDLLVTEKGIAESREKARVLIMSGSVFVNGQRADKPGAQFSEDADVEFRGEIPKYVSRGGLKLEKALAYFGVSPEGKICIDCGASTGGFTDCLLQNGAEKVYAVDVGYGQLAWSIRNDDRVVVMERTNIRYVTPDMISDRPELAVIDVSFISLALVLPVVRKLLDDNGEVLCLIKPQFEAGREKVGKKGVVRDMETHKEVLENFVANAKNAGFYVRNITFSPIRGPEGNIEYLGYLAAAGEDAPVDIDSIVEESHAQL